MALKRDFNDDEKVGLTQREIELGEKYLRKHKTAGAIDDIEALKLYEMFLIGSSFHEIQQQFPQYEVGQIVLTAALKKWGVDREKMQGTLRDRVRAKVVKSVIEQVDFLTSMLSVANVEHLEEMRRYILDANSPKPSLRISSIKDYKEVTETLSKIVQGATPNAKNNSMSPMFDALAPNNPKSIEKKKDDDDIDLDSLLDKGDQQ
jgi:hypothetical protein